MSSSFGEDQSWDRREHQPQRADEKQQRNLDHRHRAKRVHGAADADDVDERNPRNGDDDRDRTIERRPQSPRIGGQDMGIGRQGSRAGGIEHPAGLEADERTEGRAGVKLRPAR